MSTKRAGPDFNVFAEECIGVRARLLNRVITSIYDDAFRPIDLRMTQFNILAMLGTIGDASPRDVENILALEQSTVSRNLSILRRNRWVETVPDEEDHRAVLYRLTPAGREKMKQAEPRWREAQTRARKTLGREGATQLVGAADRVWTSLDQRAPTKSR